MSVLTTINSSDLITNSRTDLNNNFAALNNDKMETSVLDTDTALTANSDAKVPTQKAVKAYVDSQTGAAVVRTMTNATASRALSTTYQNTTGKTLIIMITLGKASDTSNIVANGYVGDTSPASTLVVSQGVPNMTLAQQLAAITFVVLSGKYYRVTGGGGSEILNTWFEFAF